MGQVLYRKYRSKSLDEIVGQEHITTTLKNALQSGAISHAYLFTGPRGVGKTSIARILAHELNELAYTDESVHLDIIEIDAASNRGIDEIRDLREKVHIAPSSGKYKVYIIDEVHMLTTPAFNALLKTLEEPPAHAVFILATTEVHKLPETIISRTQRYTFRPVEKSKVIAHLQHIAKQEGFTASVEALELIAEHGEGSFRDSISLLNQAASHTNAITADTIQEILGLPPQQAIQALFDAVVAGDKSILIAQLTELYTQGYHAGMIAKQLGQIGRNSIIEGALEAPTQLLLLELLAKLIDIPTSAAPDRLLELTLLTTIVSKGNIKTPIEESKPASTHDSKPSKPVRTSEAIAPIELKPTVVTEVEPVAEVTPEQNESDEPANKSLQPLADDAPIEELWPQLLEAIKAKHNTIYGILRMANPQLSKGELTLTFRYSFHQKRMQEAKHRKIISDILQELTGAAVAITCLFDKDTTERTPLGLNDASAETATPLVAAAAATNSSLETVSNIFGGGELLES